MLILKKFWNYNKIMIMMSFILNFLSRKSHKNFFKLKLMDD